MFQPRMKHGFNTEFGRQEGGEGAEGLRGWNAKAPRGEDATDEKRPPEHVFANFCVPGGAGGGKSMLSALDSVRKGQQPKPAAADFRLFLERMGCLPFTPPAGPS